MPDREELELMVEINTGDIAVEIPETRDSAYYQEEAAALRHAHDIGRHGGNGPEVPEDELEAGECDGE